MDKNPFSLAVGEWYERPDRVPVSYDYEKVVRGLLKEGWSARRSGVWLHAEGPTKTVPIQGFKIHVSSAPDCAAEVLTAVGRECVARGIDFKCVAGPELHALQNGKNYHRSGGGKFITVYPPDDAAFVETIQALHERTSGQGFFGPYVLSDKRYRDSEIVFYRYGGMRTIRMLGVDGKKSGVLLTPDGGFEPDVRNPYFTLPDWVEDPFPSEPEASDRVLEDRFEVTAALATSNRGGVYEATDLVTGSTVILKEARPHINRTVLETTVVDSQSLLAHEHDILQRLRHLPFTPDPVALFSEWEHLFLAQERIDGTVLRRALTTRENLWIPYVRRRDSLSGFLPRFRKLALSILDALERIHEAGVIVGDLSSNNLLVDLDTWDVAMIDFEGAARVGEDDDLMPFLAKWATPGFTHPDRAFRSKVTFEDDYFAASRVLMHALVRTANLFQLKPEGPSEFMAFLRELGLPGWAAETIEAVRDGDFERARGSLSIGGALESPVGAA